MLDGSSAVGNLGETQKTGVVFFVHDVKRAGWLGEAGKEPMYPSHFESHLF